MTVFLWVLIITTIAGFVGTGLGGLIGAILKKDSSKIVSLLLSFAGGVMLSIVCFDMMPSAIKPEGSDKSISLFVVVPGVIVGYGLIYLLNYLIDRHTNKEVKHVDETHPKQRMIWMN